MESVSFLRDNAGRRDGEWEVCDVLLRSQAFVGASDVNASRASVHVMFTEMGQLQPTCVECKKKKSIKSSDKVFL